MSGLIVIKSDDMGKGERKRHQSRRSILLFLFHSVFLVYLYMRYWRMLRRFFLIALVVAVISLVLDYFTLQPIHYLRGSSKIVSNLWQQQNTNSSNMAASRASIVVVGGGLAGLSATLEALQQTKHIPGANVVLLEKELRTGGNSAMASSGINGVHTRTQKEKGIKDSLDAFVQDTLQSGKGKSNQTLVHKLVRDSTGAVAWLQDDYSLDLDVLARLGGHSAPRTHRRPDLNGKPQPVGWGIVSTLATRLREMNGADRFQLITGARVTKLDTSQDGQVSGVTYTTADAETKATHSHRIQSNAVILATGGFGGEGRKPDFMSKYAPQLVGLPATNGPFATGDGLRLATALGAGLVDMGQVQVHPTGFVKASDPGNAKKFLAAEALRGEGGILLNGQGKRFVNELDTRDKVTDAMYKHCSGKDTRARFPDIDSEDGLPGTSAFLVLSQDAADKFGQGALGFYARMRLVTFADDLEDLAKGLGVGKVTLQETLGSYDSARSSGKADEFGKTVFPQNALNSLNDDNADQSKQRYAWGIVTPSIHYTMGGLLFDDKTQVLRGSDRSPIPGLFAAGEVTGGLHGTNRLGGNSLLECVVYGREAGRQAAALAAKNV